MGSGASVSKSIAAAVEHFKNQNPANAQSTAESKKATSSRRPYTKGDHRRGQVRPLTYDEVIDESLLCWLPQRHGRSFPSLVTPATEKLRL